MRQQQDSVEDSQDPDFRFYKKIRKGIIFEPEKGLIKREQLQPRQPPQPEKPAETTNFVFAVNSCAIFLGESFHHLRQCDPKHWWIAFGQSHLK